MIFRWRMVSALFFFAGAVFGQQLNISGTMAWDTMEIRTVVSLDMASANVRLPAGRTQGESIINSEYVQLIRPCLLGMRIDSSSVLDDLVQSGELPLGDVDELCRNAASIPPYLSQDTLKMQKSFTISMKDISSALLRHNTPAETRRVLNAKPVQAYTGIIIIASSPLPVHGMKSSASIEPCLFPKIWDTDMNIVFDRNMLDSGAATMVNYASKTGIFTDTPSGLSPELLQLAGDRPLRIIARGLFGDTPTDPIIDSEDALEIISSAENSRLLREGRVIIIIDDSALKVQFNNQEN
ncbi:MAG: polymerase [Treponema sp.]|nr:polymerase [Treponema sp.]